MTRQPDNYDTAFLIFGGLTHGLSALYFAIFRFISSLNCFCFEGGIVEVCFNSHAFSGSDG